MTDNQSSRPKVASLLTDPGVLAEDPLLEFFGWSGVERTGGIAVLPWRADFLAARQSGIETAPSDDSISAGPFAQCVVHLQKGRAATWSGLNAAWNRLSTGGRLLLCGGNDLGVKTVVRRLEGELDKKANVLSRRAKGRVVAFERTEGKSPALHSPPPIELELPSATYSLSSAAGVFSADAIDPGSQLLIDHLHDIEPPQRLFDPGCGIGVLAFAVLLQFESCSAVLADADHRAVTCALANAKQLGLESRCQASWWDAPSESVPAEKCDLIVMNPPFHSGLHVDLDPARAMFRAIDSTLAPGGMALIVANQTLPYERDLKKLGRLDQLEVRKGFKLLRVTR
ncbi:MAG: class I SAM-dependent methyltransferase [bacterium]|nr:class I SAM-dependent methyltransferase [bacterium]